MTIVMLSQTEKNWVVVGEEGVLNKGVCKWEVDSENLTQILSDGGAPSTD